MIASLSGEYRGTLRYDDGRPNTPFIMELRLGEPFTNIGYPPNTVAVSEYPYIAMTVLGVFRFQTEDGTFAEEGLTEVRATSVDIATADPRFYSSELQGTHQVPGGNASPDDAGYHQGATVFFRVEVSGGVTQGTIDHEDPVLDDRVQVGWW